MEGIRLTSWYGEYPIIYNTVKTSRWLFGISSINGTITIVIAIIILLVIVVITIKHVQWDDYSII